MKLIALTQGKFAQVDDELFEYLNQWKWHTNKNRNTCYAIRNWVNPEGKRTKQFLYHLVIGFLRLPRELGFEADHIDGNGLNNQRTNLRIDTIRKNNQNKSRHRNGNLVGASWNKRDKKWSAQIKINGVKKSLGNYDTEQEAHKAYMAALEDLK